MLYSILFYAWRLAVCWSLNQWWSYCRLREIDCWVWHNQLFNCISNQNILWEMVINWEKSRSIVRLLVYICWIQKIDIDSYLDQLVCEKCRSQRIHPFTSFWLDCMYHTGTSKILKFSESGEDWNRYFVGFCLWKLPKIYLQLNNSTNYYCHSKHSIQLWAIEST